MIVTDITMPDRDGFDLLGTPAISIAFNQVSVLVFTGLPDAALWRLALDAGAFDLIAKPA